MDDGWVFLLSQYAESVENRRDVENLLQSLKFDLPKVKN